MPISLQKLQAVVQRNCHISDAHYAGDYTLCIYLLKMREFYRWENKLGFGEPLAQDEVGNWLKQREELWDELDEDSFAKLPVNGDLFDPFDTAQINQALSPQGMIYSGGIGHKAKPHFFLGKLAYQEIHNDYSIYVCTEEYARDLTAPPAMTLDKSIFIRRESIRRMLWERVDEWRWNKPDNAMGQAIACYDFDTDLDRALDQMTDQEVGTVLAHEIGEVMAGKQLGHAWEDLLSALPRSRTEIIARAIRDHLADALTTIPGLLDDADAAAIHLYAGNLNGMRKELCPSLLSAYHDWTKTGQQNLLRSYAEKAPAHWLSSARSLIALYNQYGEQLSNHLDQFIKDTRC